MSENLEQESIIEDLEDAVDSIDEKYHDNIENCAKVEATNAKVQQDLNTLRDCLESRKEIEKQAVESLAEGMMEFALKLLVI